MDISRTDRAGFNESDHCDNDLQGCEQTESCSKLQESKTITIMPAYPSLK